MSPERSLLRVEPASHRIIVEPQAYPDHKAAMRSLGSELPRVVGSLIKGLARDDNIFTSETRATMLHLLRVAPLQRIYPDNLRNNYVKALKWQDKDAKPEGTIKDLLLAGRILTPYLPKHAYTYSTITDAWIEIAKTMRDKEGWQEVGKTYLDLEDDLTITGTKKTKYTLKKVLSDCTLGISIAQMQKTYSTTEFGVRRYLYQLDYLGLLPKATRHLYY